MVVEKPFVSVIVPAYNDAERIGDCIEALLAQTYPQARYEVLIVDNGSSDETATMIQRFPVTLLREDETQGSYAARNKGIQHARGEIIAFTDSDCTPVPQWIEEGVCALQTQQADLAGGNVRFVYSTRPGGAEIYDSLSNMQIERNIRERQVAKTANLFVRTAVFETVGLFPQQVRSGGDVSWTGRATAQGARLVYAPRAEVTHPTRRLAELLQKQYRVGKGQAMMSSSASSRPTERLAVSQSPIPSILRRGYAVLGGFLPGPISGIRNAMRERQLPASRKQVWEVWLASWLCNVATNLGRVSATFVQKERRT